MQIYSNPETFVQDSHNKYLLRIDSKECKILLAALKSFEDIKANNTPSTKSLKNAIIEIDTALAGIPNKLNGTYQSPEGCNTCQE